MYLCIITEIIKPQANANNPKPNNQINMIAIPQIFNNKIVFDVRSGQL